jgi:xylulose-5-phosphate/fructose-6-phosphate phosphoketolase
MFCPDETNSNRLNSVLEATNRCFMAQTVSIDDELSPDGRVMEVLSEHCCQGWLEGYLLTGRHGMWSSYEAFAQVVDSMLTQHAKWLEQCRDFPWRKPVASLNVLLTSHAWRNDHNGFSHQATGFVDNALARRSETIRVYYPPDSNCLLSVFDHCLRSRNYVNIVTCGKQPQLQWLSMDEALEHCSRGASTWKFASNDEGEEPDVVLACAGDVPTIEICAASWSWHQGASCQCSGLDRSDDAGRSSAWDGQHVLQRALHQRRTCDLRLPQQSLAHSHDGSWALE